MLSRRKIMQTALAFSAWPTLRPFAAAQRSPGSGAPEDEYSWAYVRSEFEIAPAFANLVILRDIWSRGTFE